MPDYPSIRPEDVREGDVVRGTGNYSTHSATVQGAVWVDPDGVRHIGGARIQYLTDLRLVGMGRCCPTPPEPPLRVGDFVRHEHDGSWQVVGERGLTNCFGLTRIEPPVGWPVGVPDGDGRTRWYVRDSPFGSYKATARPWAIREWADLLAAGGVPALAVTR